MMNSTILRAPQSAHEAYEAGRYREAGLLYEQERDQAESRGDRAVATNKAVFAAVSWQLAANPIRGLRILTDLLAMPPGMVDPWSLWIAHVQMFEVLRDYRSDHGDISRRLQFLKQMEGQVGYWSRSDVLWLEGTWRELRGQYDVACEVLEKAWVDNKGRGFMKFLIAEVAVRCHLAQGRRSEAGRWCELLGETETYFAESRVAWLESQARLALWDHDLSALEQATRELMDHADALQRPLWQRRAQRMRVRCLLLHTHLGDPQWAGHPARRLLRTRVGGMMRREDRFEFALLLFEYRLAALRYAQGLPPQDELYGSGQTGAAAQVVSRMMGERDLMVRQTRLMRTFRHTYSLAVALDSVWACDWRSRLVSGRRERLMEAANHGFNPVLSTQCP